MLLSTCSQRWISRTVIMTTTTESAIILTLLLLIRCCHLAGGAANVQFSPRTLCLHEAVIFDYSVSSNLSSVNVTSDLCIFRLHVDDDSIADTDDVVKDIACSSDTISVAGNITIKGLRIGWTSLSISLVSRGNETDVAVLSEVVSLSCITCQEIVQRIFQV